MTLLSVTVGRFLPRFRTLSQWIEIYSATIEAKEISTKTRLNRKAHIRRISEGLGAKGIGSIRPTDVGHFIGQIHKVHPVAAKRVLIEIRGIFDEAISNGWVDDNPAKAVRMPTSRVQRRRLSLDEWRLIYEAAKLNSPPWVHRMILLALLTGQRRGDLRKMKFSDVWVDQDGIERIHVEQQKTGARIAIPVKLRLASVGESIEDVIQDCRGYGSPNQDSTLLRKTTGQPPCPESMSWRFEQAREMVIQPESGQFMPPTLHECRSLAAREYDKQGIDVMTLLGHSKQSMTDLYRNDRGLEARSGKWRTLKIVELPQNQAV